MPYVALKWLQNATTLASRHLQYVLRVGQTFIRALIGSANSDFPSMDDVQIKPNAVGTSSSPCFVLCYLCYSGKLCLTTQECMYTVCMTAYEHSPT